MESGCGVLQHQVECMEDMSCGWRDRIWCLLTIWACIKTEQKSKDWFKSGLTLRGQRKKCVKRK